MISSFHILIVGLMAAVVQATLSPPTPFMSTLTPTQESVDFDRKLYSYFCLEAEQRLCLGISTDVDPSYNPDLLYYLQVKRRDNNEAKGLDYRKLRWTVDRVNGRIQLSNFTSLCVSKVTDNAVVPGPAALRPCGTTGHLEVFDLSSFLTNVNEQGYLTLKNMPNQCLTMMLCKRSPGTDYCDPAWNKQFIDDKINADTQKGAWVRFTTCVGPEHAAYKSQSWRQTLDCAPGCSPYMMTGGKDNVCDEECRNPQCNWDNMACTTNAPTPPTPRPSRNPTTSPTTSRPSKSPTRSPTTSKPSKSPTTSAPSQNPTVSPTTSRPSARPSFSPTFSPTTSQPSRSPTFSPTGEPTAYPSRNPTTSPTTSVPSLAPSHSPSTSPTISRPSLAPSAAPSSSPSAAPSTTPSASPSAVPSRAPSASPTRSPTIPEAAGFLWLYILLAALGGLCCGCCIVGVYRRDKRKRERDEALKKKNRDVEAGPSPKTPAEVWVDIDRSSKMSKPPPPIPFHAVVPSTPARTEESGSLVQIPIEQERGPRGAVGLLWGGSHDESAENASPDRRDLKRRSERFTREQLVDVVNQRSFVMPLEKVHEGRIGEEEMEDDYFALGDQPSAVEHVTSNQEPNLSLVDPAMAVDESFALPTPFGVGTGGYQDHPSAMQTSNIEGMSIRELKSFIVENGGDYAGCVEKDQLVNRAKELV